MSRLPSLDCRLSTDDSERRLSRLSTPDYLLLFTTCERSAIRTAELAGSTYVGGRCDDPWEYVLILNTASVVAVQSRSWIFSFLQSFPSRLSFVSPLLPFIHRGCFLADVHHTHIWCSITLSYSYQCTSSCIFGHI